MVQDATGDTLALSLQYWWSELANKGYSWKLKAATRWLTSDYTGSAFEWKQGDFVACTCP